MNTTIGTEIGDWTGWRETSVVEAHAEATRSRFGGDGVAAWAWLCDEASDEEIEALGGERLPSAHDIGLVMGAAIAAERIEQGTLRLYVDQARDAVRYDRSGETDLATEILAISERLIEPRADASAGLLAEDCDAIDEALAEAGYDPRDPEIRREAQDAAAASCATDLSIALGAIADEIRRVAAAHLAGVEGGLKGCIREVRAGETLRRAACLGVEGWQIPEELEDLGVSGADLDAEVMRQLSEAVGQE